MDLFDDLLTESSKTNAKRNAYEPWRETNNLREQTEDAKIGLQNLLNACKRSKIAIDFGSEIDRERLEDVKNQYDTIAYLMEEFLIEFKPLYKDVSNQFLTEKLAGTFERDDYSTQAIPLMPKSQNGWGSKN